MKGWLCWVELLILDIVENLISFMLYIEFCIAGLGRCLQSIGYFIFCFFIGDSLGKRSFSTFVYSRKSKTCS